ncbi:hypothetical protein cgp_1200 [Corynebacterium glutamicum MB001]|nr:hypothetical protein cgp_1200 [Corynebacterium glutamicum MB001]QYO73283.1 hypothetical protein cgisf_1200 [Corynebacterium glutamicum]
MLTGICESKNEQHGNKIDSVVRLMTTATVLKVSKNPNVYL